jgi:steroid 5-alpha reductase family enzyme
VGAILLVHLLAALIALAGSVGGVTVGAWPVMAIAVALAMAIQWLAFVPAYRFQTERYYDLIGSSTFIIVTAFVFLTRGAFDERRLLLAGLIVLWALRLGSFLFLRILRDGSDSRFDRIKPSAVLFLRTWTLQGLWVVVTAGAALAALSAQSTTPLGAIGWIGVGIFLTGFAIEAVADWQKRRFRSAQGSEGFITTGLWALSRHPNYVGEILLWLGIAVLAMPALQGWQHLTLVSPLFVYLLLARLSGVPLLERKADRRWGDNPAYLAYKRTTPVLFPGGPH